jgi:hypothetical protein
MREFWNERYSSEQYAYGVLPNEYLKIQIDQLKPGSILFPAEGEGRNAVYAASLGWQTVAFDLSNEGRKKASKLAEMHQVYINYHVGELPELNLGLQQFDAIALIYAHFPPEIKSFYHSLLIQYLRPGGLIIFEAFAKKHLQYNARHEEVGGPGNLGMLFSEEELKADFNQFEFLEFYEGELKLQEGLYHNGIGYVIRFVARKL